jgi:hypothetical protein
VVQISRLARKDREEARKMSQHLLSDVLTEALCAAQSAASASRKEQTELVNDLRRLWQECERIGFPLRDDNVDFVSMMIKGIDLRKGNPASDLRNSIAPVLGTLARCAKWAEAVEAKAQLAVEMDDGPDPE